MRLTEGLGLAGEPPVQPTASWRVPSRIEDCLFQTKDETSAIRTCLLAIYAVAFFYVLAFLRRSDLGDDVAWILHLKGYVTAALVTAGLLYIYRRRLNHLHLGPGLKRLKLKVPAPDATPVKLQIIQNTAITGLDEGYLWLKEGALYYKGRQTAFRINRRDVPPLSLWNRRDIPNLAKNQIPTTLPIPIADRDLRVRFDVIDPHEDFTSRRDAAKFYAQISRWLHEQPASNIESLLPPIELHPGFIWSGSRQREPVVIAGLLALSHLTIILAMNIGTRFSGSSLQFAVTCTLLHSIFFLLTAKLFLDSRNTLKVRQSLLDPNL